MSREYTMCMFWGININFIVFIFEISSQSPYWHSNLEVRTNTGILLKLFEDSHHIAETLTVHTTFKTMRFLSLILWFQNACTQFWVGNLRSFDQWQKSGVENEQVAASSGSFLIPDNSRLFKLTILFMCVCV